MTDAKASKADEGWGLEQDESPDKLIFDTIGDEYVGLYCGIEHITPNEDEGQDFEPFDQLMFWDLESPKVIPASFRLILAMRRIMVGREVRILYVKDVDVDQPTPMKDYKVWSRPARPEWEERAEQARKAMANAVTPTPTAPPTAHVVGKDE